MKLEKNNTEEEIEKIMSQYFDEGYKLGIGLSLSLVMVTFLVLLAI
jgi:hypothetical protein